MEVLSNTNISTAAELRRAQLLLVAKELILSDGVEALRHAAVAERAGVTRAVIYRYFPTQSDFIVAIGNEFIEALKQRLSPEKQIEAARASVSSDFAAAEIYFDVVFSVLEDKGPASLMLLLEPDLTPKLKSFWASVDVEQYGHWLQESADLGITAIDSQVLIQVGKMTLLTLYKVYRAGEISRNQAVSRVSYVICSLINTLRAKPCN
tara:strand:+ start:206889 stop:207512 length:624 start_codon:yes stop_codon:yes gene_type:complete